MQHFLLSNLNLRINIFKYTKVRIFSCHFLSLTSTEHNKQFLLLFFLVFHEVLGIFFNHRKKVKRLKRMTKTS